MSKLLVQSKTFLPMVIQKSTTEAALILESHPSLSAKQSVTDKVTKHMVDDKMNIGVQRNLKLSKVTPAISETPLTLLQAFTMDLAQVQERLLLLWARGHLWVSGQRWGLLRTLPVIMGTPSHLLWVEGRPRAVDREETPATATTFTTTVPTIASETGKRRPANPDGPTRLVQQKREPSRAAAAAAAGRPLRSNLWEAVQQRSPAWQVAFATRLGALQKAVVQKLSK